MKTNILKPAVSILLACSPGLTQNLPDDQGPPQQQAASNEIIVPAGTIIPILLSTFLNSRSSQAGDTFYMDTMYPIWIQQRQVIPRGSTVTGKVTHVQRPGRIKGRGRIAFKFEKVLLPNGVTRPLTAELHAIHGPGAEKIDRSTETVEMDSSRGEDAGALAGNTAQGAIIGAIAGDGKGAAIGAGAGGALGIATVLLSRGRELVLGPGTQFDLVLKEPLRFAYAEVDFTAQELNSARGTQPYRRGYDPNEDGRRYNPGRRVFPVPWGFPWP